MSKIRQTEVRLYFAICTCLQSFDQNEFVLFIISIGKTVKICDLFMIENVYLLSLLIRTYKNHAHTSSHLILFLRDIHAIFSNLFFN